MIATNSPFHVKQVSSFLRSYLGILFASAPPQPSLRERERGVRLDEFDDRGFPIAVEKMVLEARAECSLLPIPLAEECRGEAFLQNAVSKIVGDLAGAAYHIRLARQLK